MAGGCWPQSVQSAAVSPRTIKLRRPATLSVMDTPFVPPGHLLDEVERRWIDLCRRNPAYFDGRLYHVLGVHRNGHGGAVLHVMDCAYRFFAVQDRDFDIGVRPLGLKGVTIRGSEVLMGRRAMNVAAYAGLWEFAPSGGAEPGKTPGDLIQEELMEETGLSSGAEPIPIAVMHDPVLNCWEIVFRLTAAKAAPQPRTAEYSALEWRRADDLPNDLSPIARQISALLPEMMDRG
jgi:8-oxo-dGTP pyrophosphatase MutT (NUDIX family)